MTGSHTVQLLLKRGHTELQEGIFAETNSVAAQISGRPPMTIEEFVAKNRRIRVNAVRGPIDTPGLNDLVASAGAGRNA
jgi:hypothetical protein